MRSLLELKNNIISFVEKHEYYVLCVTRLILMLIAFMLVRGNLNYYSRIDNIFIPLILAVFCAVIPLSLGAVVLPLYILLNLWGLGIEVVLVVAAVFMLAYLLYFRFAPGTGYRAILAPVLAYFKMPYILPVTSGLRGTPGSVVSVLCGMTVYYLLVGIKANESVFLGANESTSTDKIAVVLNQVIKNRELWIVLASFFLTTIVVYTIRRLSIKNAWRTASVAGIAINMVFILCGKLLLGEGEGIIWLIVGSVISLGIAFVYEFFFMHLDYTRVEQVQFEDDNYYYYVKAVPKVLLQAKQKSVKRFNQKQSEAEEDRKKEQLAKELEIDRSLLK